jgi:alkylation response protein AidB-like acyl-CoA dehydrogenase
MRDIRFVLHEVLHDEAHYRDLGRTDIGQELIDSVLEQCARFTEEVIAPTNEPGDRVGVRREADGSVVTPPGFAAAYQRYVEDGWAALCGPAEYGGQGLPESFGVPAAEMMAAANMAWKVYSGLSDSAVLLLRQHAAVELRRQYLPQLVSGEWLASMCLTEAHAGTDLGLMRTRAERAGWLRIAGAKIFITGGERLCAEHRALGARCSRTLPRVAGISLFLVPKFLPDAAGEPGEANGVSCASVEHKLGIHGSATCVMNFDGATGWLVGGPHEGLRCMFTMMNHARLWVGIQGLAQSEAALQVATAYARERRQGRTTSGNDQGGADPIIGHPDVRRMLLTQKALIEGSRVLVYLAGLQLDKSIHHPDPAERERASGLLSVLTPIVKAFVTDRSLECTSHALQIHGGHGYVRETGVEQYFRDARITAIYEGANGVQAMDLLGRKVLGSGGVLARQLGGLIGSFCENHARYDELIGFVPRLAGLLGMERGDRGHRRACRAIQMSRCRGVD